MLRADELTVVHHDDSESRFTDVTYTIGREGVRVISATGDEKAFPQHDVLTTVAFTRPVIPTQRGLPGTSVSAPDDSWVADRRVQERRASRATAKPAGSAGPRTP
jgi:hypothetical protein